MKGFYRVTIESTEGAIGDDDYSRSLHTCEQPILEWALLEPLEDTCGVLTLEVLAGTVANFLECQEQLTKWDNAEVMDKQASFLHAATEFVDAIAAYRETIFGKES